MIFIQDRIYCATMKNDLHTIRGILWDLDSTLYAPAEDVNHSFNCAVAQAAIECGVNISFEDAVRMAAESFDRHRHSAHVFIHEYNIPFVDMHHLTDRYLDHSLVRHCDLTERLFRTTQFDHALITHAARPWALNVLERIGLRPWFPDHRVFAYENYAFESKARSRKPFEMALESINKNPRDSVMVEDTVDNLRIAHEMGMTTIFVHHDAVLPELPDFVDMQCKNAPDVLRTLHSSAS